MLKFLSDVECLPEKNCFSVEWEYESGYRCWESFENEEKMIEAIAMQQMELADYKLDQLLADGAKRHRYINFATEYPQKLPNQVKALAMINAHNARIKATRKGIIKKAMFSLGEVYDFSKLKNLLHE